MKKIFFLLLFLFVLTKSGQCVIFEWADTAVGKLFNQAEQQADRIWKNSMLKQAIDSYTTMKKNYDESVSFYQEMKRISNNPNELKDYVANRFTERGQEALNRQYRQAQTEYDTDYYAKDGWVTRLQNAGDKYIENKLDFSRRQNQLSTSAKDIQDNYKMSANVMGDNRKRQEQFSNDIIPKAKTNNKDKVEEAKLAAQMLMTETLLSMERTQAKTLATINALYEQWKIGQIDQLEREKEYARSLAELQQLMRNAQQGQRKTSVDALNKLLR